METIRTDYGTAEKQGNTVVITATEEQIYAWTKRPRAHWPCSSLLRIAHNTGKDLRVELWKGDVCEVAPASQDLSGIEFDAWLADVLKAAGVVRYV